MRPEPYDARLAGDPVCQGPRGPGGHLGGPGAEGELAPQKGRRRRVEGWLGPGLRGGTQAEAWRGAVELGAQEKPSSTPPASMTAFPSPIVQRALYPGMSTPGGRFRGPQCAHLWALVGPWGWRACVCVPSGVQVGPHFSLALPSTPGLVYSVPLLLASVCLWPLSCVCVCVCVCVCPKVGGRDGKRDREAEVAPAGSPRLRRRTTPDPNILSQAFTKIGEGGHPTRWL